MLTKVECDSTDVRESTCARSGVPPSADSLCHMGLVRQKSGDPPSAASVGDTGSNFGETMKFNGCLVRH